MDLSEDDDSMSFVEMSEETFKNLILKFGKKATRSWSLKEYKIFEWVLHSDNFLAFFFENKEDKYFYEEIKLFQSTGLILPNYVKNIFELESKDSPKEAGEFEKRREFFVNLSPGQTHMLILRIENGRPEFKYRYTTKFKIF